MIFILTTNALIIPMNALKKSTKIRPRCKIIKCGPACDKTLIISRFGQECQVIKLVRQVF